jgi:hypothetical protein
MLGLTMLMAVASCSGDGSSPDELLARQVRGGATRLDGRVVGVIPGFDSAGVPVGGAQVVILHVGPLPPDTTGPTNPPGDTMTVRPVRWHSHLLDSIPVDTVPTDTIPPDSTPPPPVFGCGRPSDTVATRMTTRNGAFRIAALPEGVYDLQVSAPPGSGFGSTFFCGIFLRAGDPVEVTVRLPGSVDSTGVR